MAGSTDNIEPVARAACARIMREAGWSETDVALIVEKDWPCVAADMQAGLTDDAGRPLPGYSYDRSLDAWRVWCAERRGRPVA